MNRVQVLAVFCICLQLRNILAEVQEEYKDRQCDPIQLGRKSMLQMNCKESWFAYGSSCSFTCFFGYKVKGAASITCQLNKENKTEWSSSIPKCEEDSCPDLMAPFNSAMHCIPLKAGKYCSMACKENYYIPATKKHGGEFFCVRSNGWNNTVLSNCTEYCPPGSKEVNNRCVECEHGTYQELEGQTLCEKCPGGGTTESTGSNSSVFCIAATSTTEIQTNGKQWPFIVVIVAVPVVLIVCVAFFVVIVYRRRACYKAQRVKGNKRSPNDIQVTYNSHQEDVQVRSALKADNTPATCMARRPASTRSTDDEESLHPLTSNNK